jgi:hypothetical protein
MRFVWRDAPEELLPAAFEGKADEAAATCFSIPSLFFSAR